MKLNLYCQCVFVRYIRVTIMNLLFCFQRKKTIYYLKRLSWCHQRNIPQTKTLSLVTRAVSCLQQLDNHQLAICSFTNKIPGQHTHTLPTHPGPKLTAHSHALHSQVSWVSNKHTPLSKKKPLSGRDYLIVSTLLGNLKLYNQGVTTFTI